MRLAVQASQVSRRTGAQVLLLLLVSDEIVITSCLQWDKNRSMTQAWSTSSKRPPLM